MSSASFNFAPVDAGGRQRALDLDIAIGAPVVGMRQLHHARQAERLMRVPERSPEWRAGV